MTARWRGVVVGLIGGAYAVSALAVLLWRDGEQVRQLLLRVYLFGLNDLGLPSWVTPGTYAALGNVLLFVPFGVAVAALVARPGRPLSMVGAAAGAGLLVSVAIEWVQTRSGWQRVPELSDVLLNSGGALLGAVLLRGWLGLRGRQRPGGPPSGSGAPSEDSAIRPEAARSSRKRRTSSSR